MPRVHPVEQQSVRPARVGRGRDAAQVPEQPDERVLDLVGAEGVRVSRRQPVAQIPKRRHKRVKLFSRVVHEEQPPEGGVEDGPVPRVDVLRQEREVIGRVRQ